MKLRIIPTRVHGILDYATGAALLGAPQLFGLSAVPASARAAQLAGGGAAAYSMLTDYELGAVKWLPMPAHLAFDALSGVMLAASPWLFGFAKAGKRYWLPHTIVGGQEVLAALMTKTQPPYKASNGS